jgi:GMP synthase-like glutamine amidotransferase
MAPGLILQQEESAPPALFGDWCRRRGIGFDICRAWEVGPPADHARLRWVCALGSEHTPGGAGAPPWVDAEVGFLRRALEAGVPILGLCFGGQALAAAAGAQVAPADPPEVGWMEIETDDPERIPAGPWLHFHYYQLSVPPGAIELARTPAGPAAFALGPSLGLQFHPECTPAIADAWAASEEERLLALGISPSAVAAQGLERAGAAAEAADALFDAWWSGLDGIDRDA